MDTTKEKVYFTVKDVFEAAVALARTDPSFVEAEKKCSLDYERVCSDSREDVLRFSDFEVIGLVTYGTSEGIYGDLYLYGSWNQETRMVSGNSYLRVYVLKTLNEEKDAYLAMGIMVNIIAYYANEFVRTHLNRFD